jgi:hypothetical protein
MNLNKVSNNRRRINNNQEIIPNNIIVISYDEYINNFNETDITSNVEFVNYIKKHKYIVLCTQKSKSSSTRSQITFGLTGVMHFQHIFKTFIEKNNYIQFAKYDSSTPFSAELTDNYSTRTRIFIHKAVNKNTIENITFQEIKDGSFRNYFRNTANKTALLCRFTINNNNTKKTYNIVNTDLFSLKFLSRPMYNDGLLYKQQQFLAIIKYFKLYDKYADKTKNGINIIGENIILAGSLKFNIYPLKMTNILNLNNRQKVNTYLLSLKDSIDEKNKEKLKKYNELNKYLNKLIKNYSNTIPNNIIPNNIIASNVSKSIKNIINKYNIEHEQILGLLKEFKNNLKMNITGNSRHEMINPGGVGYVIKGFIKSTESLSRGITERISSTRSNNTISAKDRILYALKDQNKDPEYKTFNTNKKLDSTTINKIKNFSVQAIQITKQISNKNRLSFVNNKFITLSID